MIGLQLLFFDLMGAGNNIDYILIDLLTLAVEVTVIYFIIKGILKLFHRK